jgi:endonuclease/exonuclease/phosphatase family metal-dependent hydrolase
MGNPGLTCHMSTPLVMKFATFNLLSTLYTKFSTVHHAGPSAPPRTLETPAQRDARRAAAQATIDGLQADVLCTQEHDVDFSVMGFAYQVMVTAWDRQEGCRVLSNVPFRWSMGLELGEGKTAAIACLVNGVVVVSTHLKGGPDSGPIQQAQVARILQFVPKGSPCVFAGDLNATDPVKVFGATLEDHGLHRVPSSTLTGMNSALDTLLTLDHVFVRDLTATELVTGCVPRPPWTDTATSTGSDHAPLLVELQ